MNEIQRQVKRAKRRMNVGYFFRSLVTALTLGLLLGCLAFAIPRIWALSFVQSAEQLRLWHLSWLVGAVGTALLATFLVTWLRRSSSHEAAIEIDKRFALKERVSSALGLTQNELVTPVGQSLYSDAQERVARVDVRDQFQFHPTRRALMPLIPAAILAGLFFVPPVTPDKTLTTKNAVVEKEEITTAIEQAKKVVEEKAKILSEKGLDKAAQDLQALKRELDNLDSGNEDLKKEALVKLNDLKQTINDEMKKMGDVDSIKKEFERLADVAPGPAKEMADALADGDMEKAKKVIKDLVDKIKNDNLTEEEKQKLAENLGDLAKAMDKLAADHEQQKKDLEEQIKRALQEGDPQKAADLQKKLDQKNEQDKQIQKMQGIADNLKKCADCMNQNKDGKPKDGDGKSQAKQQGDGKDNEGSGQKNAQAQKEAAETLQDMLEQIVELEMDQDAMEALKDLEADLQDCKDCMNGCPNPGKSDKPGQKDFANGEGRGHGEREKAETETGEYKSRVKGQLQKGQTVVTGQADGDNSTTGTVIDARETIAASMTLEADPIEDQQLPKAQREQAKQYFEKLRKGK